MWRAICSHRLQPTCVCVAAARLLLDKLVIYGRERLRYIAVSCRRISWMEVSLQDDMGRCRAACLLHNSRGVLISTDELLTEPIRLWCLSNTTRKHLTGFWEHLIAFALSSSQAVTACSAAGQHPLTPTVCKNPLKTAAFTDLIYHRKWDNRGIFNTITKPQSNCWERLVKYFH